HVTFWSDGNRCADVCHSHGDVDGGGLTGLLPSRAPRDERGSIGGDKRRVKKRRQEAVGRNYEAPRTKPKVQSTCLKGVHDQSDASQKIPARSNGFVSCVGIVDAANFHICPKE